MSAHRRSGFVWLILAMLAVALLNRALVPLAGPYTPPSVRGALFFAYIISQMGLVAAWAALADRVFWAARVVVVLLAGTAIYWASWAWSGRLDRDFGIVFASHFTQVVIVLAVLRLAGFRLGRIDRPAASSVEASQFSLKKLLVFISLVAVLLAIARAAWTALQFSAPGFGQLVTLNFAGGILAVLTLAAIVAILIPKQPLLWGLLACLLSALVGVGVTLLDGKFDTPLLIVYTGPGLIQIAVMCIVRRLGWRLRRGAPSPEVAHSSEPAAVGSLRTG